MRGVEVDPGGSDRPRQRRLAARRARRRRAGAPARLPGRRRLPHRRRRAHARRRDGPATAQARPDDRQPARGRAGYGGRPARARERGRASRALLGAPRRRRELRHRHVVRVPAASARPRGHVRHGHSPARTRPGARERCAASSAENGPGRALALLRRDVDEERGRYVRRCTADRRPTPSATSPACARSGRRRRTRSRPCRTSRRSDLADESQEWGHRFYMKSAFLPALPDEAVDVLVEHVAARARRQRGRLLDLGVGPRDRRRPRGRHRFHGPRRGRVAGRGVDVGRPRARRAVPRLGPRRARTIWRRSPPTGAT